MERDIILADVKRIDPLCQEDEDTLVDYMTSALKTCGIPYETLIANWEAHLRWWQTEYGDKEKRFLKATERAERKDIIEFIETKSYKIDWNVTTPKKRDGYLFPAWITDIQLNDLIKAVHDRIEESRKIAINRSISSGQDNAPGG